jgi:transposase
MIVDLEFEYVIADRSYAVQHFLEAILDLATPVIPPTRTAKHPWEYDRWRYRERHVVECLIGKLKHFRVFSLASTSWLDAILVLSL